LSQYPSPYTPPTPEPGYYGSYGYPDLLAPAKRASILMFVIGGLSSLCGVCVLGLGALVPMDQLNSPEMAEMQRKMAEVGISMRALFIVAGIVMLLPGLLFTVLGFFVRRGGRGAIITSIVFTSLAILWFALNAIVTAVSSRNEPPSQVVGGVCVSGIALALTILLLAWLVQAIRNSSQIGMMAAQQQAQYWQYQQQQYYAQGGYGAPAGPYPPTQQQQQQQQQQQSPPQQMPPPPTFNGPGGPSDGSSPQ
jgi:hypothetical protein